MGDICYFAYGSNLSIDRKEQRTDAIRDARVACLRGYRLAFNKPGARGEVYANIVPSPEDMVWGVVYLCNPAAMASLDAYEGVSGGHYRREPVEVHVRDGTIMMADVYIASGKLLIENGRPSDSYLHRILQGARQHGLPEQHIRLIEQLAGRG